MGIFTMINNNSSPKECDRDNYDINRAVKDILAKQQQQQGEKK